MNETAQKILGYIKRLPETWDGQPLRKQALDNFLKEPTLFYADVDIKSFMPLAFPWSETYEGAEYWLDISIKIEDGTIQLLPEEKKEEFVWTDELVAEFTSWSLTKSPTMQGRYADIEQFKASKQRKPLFTTEDGKQIFEGDEYWYVWVESDYEIIKHKAKSCTIKEDGIKDFSTETAAREYVRLNKPMYSLNDIQKVYYKGGVYSVDELKAELEKLKQ